MNNSAKKTIFFIIIALIIGFCALIFHNYKEKFAKFSQSNIKVDNNSGVDINNNNSASVQEQVQQPQTQQQDSKPDIIQQENNKSLASDTSLLLQKNKINQDDIVIGDKNAKVLIFEYASLSCPHCANFHRESFDKLKEEYIDKGSVAFIHRHFIINQPSLMASMLVECKSQNLPSQQKAQQYYKFLKALFRTQDSWAFDQKFAEKLKSIAILDGFDSKSFDDCVNNKSLQQKIINQFIQNKNSLQLESAPTFFINNRVLNGYSDYATIKKLIDEELSK